MSDPKPAEPDDELLEFLGGIDEINADAGEEDFTEFLARAESDPIATSNKPKAADEGEGDE